LREWRQQFQRLESVDLRYDRQIIVNPDLPGASHQPPVSLAAAKAAISAGVKPAVLMQRSPAKASSPHVIAVKPTANRAQKSARWHKHSATKHNEAKPKVTNAALTMKAKPSPKKPSPAIAKGQSR